MRRNNWLGLYDNLASRINWVRRARRFLNRKARLSAPGYVLPGQSAAYAPSRWISSPRMRRALQRQQYVATISQFEMLEDRTLLAANLLFTTYAGESIAGTANNNVTIGTQFTVGGSPITISELGVYDAGQNGLGTSHPVGLWTSGGSLVAQGSVTPASPLIEDWRFVDIPDVVLSANTTYRIASLVLVPPDNEPFSGTLVPNSLISLSGAQSYFQAGGRISI